MASNGQANASKFISAFSSQGNNGSVANSRQFNHSNLYNSANPNNLQNDYQSNLIAGSNGQGFSTNKFIGGGVGSSYSQQMSGKMGRHNDNNNNGLNNNNMAYNNRYTNNNTTLENDNSQSFKSQSLPGRQEHSPVNSSELYKSKSKLGASGRKGHQVSQSGGFKHLKNSINRSVDVSSLNNQDLFRNQQSNNSSLNIQVNNSTTQQQTALTTLNTIKNGSNSQQQENIGTPSNFSIKLNSLNNNTSILSQFQTIQNNSQAASHKRNQSLQGINQSANFMNGFQNQGKKLISTSIDNKKGIRPLSRAGQNGPNFSEMTSINNSNQSNINSLKTSDVPNSRGSRFMTSNNKRINLIENENLSMLQDQSRQQANATELSMMTSNIKANLLLEQNKIPLPSGVNGIGLNSQLGNTNTSFKSGNGGANGIGNQNNRPKTSIGYNNQGKNGSGANTGNHMGSFLDKYNSVNSMQTTTITDQSQDQALDLKNELDTIVNQGRYRSNTDGLQGQQLNSQPKSFIIKKGDRNEGLRNYLRKSLDSSQNRQKQSENNISTTINSLSTLNAADRASFQSMNNNMQKAKSQSQQQNLPQRKRDYSKVIAGHQQLSLQKQTINNIINLSPTKTSKSSTLKKNLYQDQFNQMNEQKEKLMNQIQQSQSDSSNKNGDEDQNNEKGSGRANGKRGQPGQQEKPSISGGSNSRAQTSHQKSRSGSNFHPGVSMLKNNLASKDGNNSTIEDKNQTIDQSVEDVPKSQKSKSEERPQSRYKNTSTNNFHNLRASITQEVSTQPQENNGGPGAKKVDNCVSKFAFATKTGFSPSNPYKTNQDSFLAMPHLGEYRRTHFFSVCDGHGVYGKEVSDYVKTQLGQKVETEIKQIFDNAKQMQRVVDSNEVKDALAVSFSFVTHQLYTNSGIDIYFSGSTCVSVLIVGNKVFCANVGDSRAVLARDVDGQLNGFPLNRDHKASEPDEEKRILMNGGRIESFKDSQGRQLGPLRVWHLNENIPGLAMSRSFGDHAAAEVGVISEPEILEMNLIEDDKFIVIASDGVWEFLSNDEVVRIIQPHYNNNSAEKAAEALIRESLKRWKQEENVVDDITCIIIFLSIQ